MSWVKYDIILENSWDLVLLGSALITKITYAIDFFKQYLKMAKLCIYIFNLQANSHLSWPEIPQKLHIQDDGLDHTGWLHSNIQVSPQLEHPLGQEEYSMSTAKCNKCKNMQMHVTSRPILAFLGYAFLKRTYYHHDNCTNHIICLRSSLLGIFDERIPQMSVHHG